MARAATYPIWDVEARGDSHAMWARMRQADPVHETVIAELLGVPAEDRDRFRTWSRVLLAPAADPVAAQEAAVAFSGYIDGLAAQRLAEPEDDLLSRLVAAEDQGDQLDRSELLGMVLLLLVAGHERTVNLIGNGVLALLDHPAAWRELVAEPTLAPAVVEEVLRCDAPVEVAPLRFTYEDVTVGEVTIPRGALVAPVLLAANRDPERFENPETFGIHRKAHHLAFGHGIHFCLGAPLARLEGAIVFEQLARRFPSMELRCERSELRWLEGLLLRGVTALPVTVTP